MKDTIYPGRAEKRDLTSCATIGRELVNANPGSDLILPEIGELLEMLKDDPANGWFNVIGLAFSFGVCVGAQLENKEPANH